MLLPNVTWGDLRSILLFETQNETISADNLLANNPEMYAESFNHEDDELVWPDRAKKFLDSGEIPEDTEIEDLDEGPDTITAAGDEEPEEDEEEFDMPSPLYFTVDADGSVLELVKADDEGLFIRIEQKWVDISDEEEFPTVYEQDMHFANDESVAKWDAEFEDNENLKLSDIENYLVK